jgi:hypothetical protein
MLFFENNLARSILVLDYTEHCGAGESDDEVLPN